MIQNPSISFYSFEQIIPLVVASLFADANVDLDAKKLGMSCPSANALKDILKDGAVDVIAYIRDLIRKNNSPIFILADK